MRFLWMGALLAVLGLAPPALARDAKPDGKKVAGKTYRVPYRLTKTSHILVRAKINGKGPYNFIVDTGAPLLFISTKVAKKLGLEPDDDHFAVVGRFEMEGGATVLKEKARIEDPYQLQGMNGLGLAGKELHGIIGYSVLAHFRMTFDFNKTKMEWTELNYKPAAPVKLAGKEDAKGVDAMAKMVELAVGMIGKRPLPEIKPRGFLGFTLAAGKDGVAVGKVIAKGPAERAGLKAGDMIKEFGGKKVKKPVEVLKHAAEVVAGDTVKLTVVRDGTERTIDVKA